jgi:hypothetical protein
MDDWIYCTLYIHTVRNYTQYSDIADIHTLQFTVTHALGSLASTSRIVATDLSVSLSLQLTHEVFLAQSNSFLAIFSITFDCHLQNSTQFYSSTVLYSVASSDCGLL